MKKYDITAKIRGKTVVNRFTLAKGTVKEATEVLQEHYDDVGNKDIKVIKVTETK